MLKKIVEKHKLEKERTEKLLKAINNKETPKSAEKSGIKAKFNEHGELDIVIDQTADLNLSKIDADPMYADRVFQIE